MPNIVRHKELQDGRHCFKSMLSEHFAKMETNSTTGYRGGLWRKN